MEQYVDDFGKMALALTSAQLAKDVAISEHGIGEDVATHFLGWSPKYLMLIAQMKQSVTNLPHEIKFEKCKELCELMRKFWGIASLTMVAEGYCSYDAAQTKGSSLAAAFVDRDNSVSECITISHASIDDSDSVTPVSMVAAPYSVSIGKKVDWAEMLFYPEKADKYLKQAKYPQMIRNSLMGNVVDEVSQGQIMRVRDEIDELGFLIQDFTV